MWPSSPPDGPRPAGPRDIPALKNIFRVCFGDTEESAAVFFGGAFGADTAAVVCEEGRAVSMLHMLPCSLRGAKGLYVYAVATLPEYRGRGHMRALEAFCCRFARENGRVFTCLVPADEGLFALYGRLGYRNFSGLTKSRIHPENEVDITHISAGGTLAGQVDIKLSVLNFDEFYRLRSAWLARFANPVRFEGKYELYAYDDYLHSGGNILGAAGGYLCIRPVEGENGALEITETTLPRPLLRQILPALPGFGREGSVYLRTPGGQPFSMLKPLGGFAAPAYDPAGNYFNFALD